MPARAKPRLKSHVTAKPKLSGLSDIYRFLRRNETPIYVVTPTPFSLIGPGPMGRRLGVRQLLRYLRGTASSLFVPALTEAHEFKSMEDVANYLVAHPQFRAKVATARAVRRSSSCSTRTPRSSAARSTSTSPFRPMRFATGSTPRSRRHELATRQASLGAEHSRPSHHLFELMALADGAELGRNLVVQTPYGDSGRTTFFIRSEADWDRYAPKIVEQELKVMKRINHLPGTIEGCATRHGTLVGPVMTDITGFAEITPYKGGWCGNDVLADILPEGVPEKVREMARKFGDRLYGEGYKGVFCLDFLLDTDTDTVYLGELNPRISGASPPTNLITTTYGGCPLFLFHLLEYFDVDWELDLAAVSRAGPTTTTGPS